MRKIANEKIVGFKLSKGITHTRTDANRNEVEKYKQTMTVSIFDFFYQMRLRLNYRNFDFVDNVPADQTKAYFDGYFTTAGHFFKCFSNLRNKLVADISIGTTS